MIEASFEAVVPKAINAEFEAIIPREKAFDIVNKDIHIDTNGKYEVKADAGTAMTQVNVEVEVPNNIFQETMIDNTGKGISDVKNVEIKEGITRVGGYSNSSIISYKLPTSLKSIGSYSFYNNSKLVEINIPDGVTTIEGAAFYATSNLVKLNIPKSLVTLGDAAFQGTKIKNALHIPKGVTIINRDVFNGPSKSCSYFSFFEHDSIPTLANVNAFSGLACNIYVPDALYDQWIVATNWATYASRIVKASEFVEPTNN